MVLIAVPFLLSARENPFIPVTITEIKVSQPKSTPKIHPQRPQVETTQDMPEQSKAESSELGSNIESVSLTAEPAAPEIDPQSDIYDKEIINYDQARFVIRENSVSIETKDKRIRSFSISTPPSIVIDFEAPAEFFSKRKELSVKPFIKLEMGAHHDHYRVVLRLDKKHKYKIETKKDGQVVTILD